MIFMLKLFNFDYLLKQSDESPLLLLTPLGQIKLEVVINGSNLSKNIPDCIGEVSRGSSICCWIMKNIHIELFKSTVQTSLPQGMSVSACIAFLWRFKVLEDTNNLQFLCRFESLVDGLEGEPESGEDLIAQSWGNKKARVTIGTQDEEALMRLVGRENGMPSRFAQNDVISPEMIEYLSDGIQILLPPFLENEQGQVQFVIAWVEGKEKNDISTWYAVDLFPEEILMQKSLRRYGDS